MHVIYEICGGAHLAIRVRSTLQTNPGDHTLEVGGQPLPEAIDAQALRGAGGTSRGHAVGGAGVGDSSVAPGARRAKRA